MAEPRIAPGVYALPPGADFAAEVRHGLLARLAGAGPAALAGVEIWTNTGRARRRLQAAFEDGPVCLPPRIRAFSDMAADTPGLPPELPPLRLRLQLARLTRELIRADPGSAAETDAWPLAESLGDLLAEMRIEAVTLDALRGLDAPEAAGHWQRALAFLQLIAPVLEAGDAEAEPEQRLVLAMAARIARWVDAPPGHPVLVAGSTGARGATAHFMAAVAGLPQGAVILPGLDRALPARLWPGIAPGGETAEHPQAGLAGFCARLGADPAALPGWTDAASPEPARAALISLALRPAPVTDQWRAEGPAMAPQLAAATGAVTLLEAPDPLAEARAIALILRAAAADGSRAALVTPDRTLARRVTAELGRWGILPDDSAGRPMDLTPPGIFLRLVAGCLGGAPDPVRLVALLKHPLAASAPGARGAHLAAARALEGWLRAGRAGPAVDGPALARFAGDAPDAAAWARWLGAALPRPVAGAAALSALAAELIRAAEALSAGPEAAPGDGGLWAEDDGARARALTDDLAAHAAAGGEMTAAEFATLLRGVLAGSNLPDPPYRAHPRIAIWGALEARAQAAELTVLGGLNEGAWPQLPRPDPWLSREMRAAVGLPLPERQIGLSAHDFQQAANAPRVVLSRALRDGEAPTVPARWLLRLTNLMQGLGAEGEAALGAMRARGRHWTALSHRLETPARVAPAPRPGPVVPPHAFPRRLYVTRIESLSRDPYAVYARHVLGLRVLDPLSRSPDALLRGQALHGVMELFVDRTRAGLPPDAGAVLEAVIAEVLAEIPYPASRVLWAGKLRAAAPRILDGERARRARAQPWDLEAHGLIAVPGLPRPLELGARADRIDCDGAGGVAIYDYKAGDVPSEPQAQAFHVQIPLEWGIAARGGFAGLDARTPLALELLGLGTQKTRPYPADPGWLAEKWQQMHALLAALMDGRTPWAPRLKPQFVHQGSDYDHLSRFGEWAHGDPIAREALE